MVIGAGGFVMYSVSDTRGDLRLERRHLPWEGSVARDERLIGCLVSGAKQLVYVTLKRILVFKSIK